MSTKEYPIVDNAESFEAALARVREAQKIFATYTQEQVDKIFLAAATAANHGNDCCVYGIGIWHDGCYPSGTAGYSDAF